MKLIQPNVILSLLEKSNSPLIRQNYTLNHFRLTANLTQLDNMTNLALFTRKIKDKKLIQKFLMNVGREHPKSTLRTQFYWDELNDILNETQRLT